MKDVLLPGSNPNLQPELVGNKPLKVLSLFSGCGGMDLGFEGGFQTHIRSIGEKYADYVAKTVNKNYVQLKPTRFKTILANDIFIDAKNTWLKNFSKYGYSKDVFLSDSIVDLVKRHENGESVFPDDIDIVTGGFPCNDFSISGLRKGFDSHKDHYNRVDPNVISEETRGKLYYWMKKVIDITEPKIFIAENVKGLANLHDVKNTIQSDFASANGNGYLVLDPQVLHSANFGIPQSRERLIFIGIKKSELSELAKKELGKKNLRDDYNPYPQRSHSAEDYMTVSDALQGIGEPSDSDDISHMHYSKAKFMGKHCQGQTEVNLNGIGPTIRAEHHGNIEFRRLSIEHGGKHDNELELGLPERRLSVRECGLIQSFPPDFEFVIPATEGKKKFLVSPSQAYKVVGNAVPPLLAYKLAVRIDSLWNKYFIS